MDVRLKGDIPPADPDHPDAEVVPAQVPGAVSLPGLGGVVVMPGQSVCDACGPDIEPDNDLLLGLLLQPERWEAVDAEAEAAQLDLLVLDGQGGEKPAESADAGGPDEEPDPDPYVPDPEGV